MWVTDAGKDKRIHRQDLNYVYFWGSSEVEAILPMIEQIFIKRTVAASLWVLSEFYLGVIIRHFTGGVFWISDVLASIYWSSEINGMGSCRLLEK